MKQQKTHSEYSPSAGKTIYYAIVYTKSGNSFYIGPYYSRSTARRRGKVRQDEITAGGI